MIALLKTYLSPYKATLALVVGLLVIQALATLYLPELNGEIINNGVAKGDTGYIISTGALMLGDLGGRRRRIDHRRLLRLEDRHGVRARRARRHLPQGRELLARGARYASGRHRSSPATRTTSSRSRWSS